jgi:predicted transcriptional regulator
MSKTANKTANNYAQLAKKYSLFKNVEHLNGTVAKHLYHKTHLLNKNTIAVYKLLARYAVKFCGTAFIKHDTLAESIGISRRTVIRAIDRLIELRIIAKKNVLREKAGGYGSNLYILLPYSTSDTAHLSQREEPEQPSETSDKTVENDDEAVISKSIIEKFNKRFSRKNPYNRFKSLVLNRTGDKKLLYKIYGVFLMNIKWLRSGYDINELTDIGLYALREAFKAFKKGKVRSLTGYYNGVLRNCLDALYEETMTGCEYYA